MCGQKHNVGRVGWDNVEQDVKKLVGNKNSRSLISFFMQLFGRSGYMISDYISGRRQVCSSPVTMLGLIAAGTLLVLNSTGKAPHAGDALVTDGRFGMMGMGLEWMSSHLNLAILIETALLVFPTWLLFRFAPKHYKHTLPEGIYIQVFMGSLVLFGIMLRAALSDWLLLFIPLVYYIAYHQLFGYGVWSTLWRVLICLGDTLFIVGVFMMAVFCLSDDSLAAEYSAGYVVTIAGILIGLGVGLLVLGWWIGKKMVEEVPNSALESTVEEVSNSALESKQTEYES